MKEQLRNIAREGYEGRGIFNPVQFNQDMNVLLSCGKMATRFVKSGKTNEKLLINNVICTLNVFGPKKANHLFRVLCAAEQYAVLKSILIFLGYHDKKDVLETNRLMDDILKSIRLRYNLSHLEDRDDFNA